MLTLGRVTLLRLAIFYHSLFWSRITVLEHVIYLDFYFLFWGILLFQYLPYGHRFNFIFYFLLSLFSLYWAFFFNSFFKTGLIKKFLEPCGYLGFFICPLIFFAAVAQRITFPLRLVVNLFIGDLLPIVVRGSNFIYFLAFFLGLYEFFVF